MCVASVCGEGMGVCEEDVCGDVCVGCVCVVSVCVGMYVQGVSVCGEGMGVYVYGCV